MSDSFNSNFDVLLESGEYSDLLIRCGEHEYKVHKAIVCPQSTFFASACKGNFVEAESGVINLIGEEHQTIYRVLSFLYTADFDDGSDKYSEVAHTTEGEIKAIRHVLRNLVRVYKAADKFGIPLLKNLAESRLEHELVSRIPVDPLIDVADFAYRSLPSNDRSIHEMFVNKLISSKLDVPTIMEAEDRRLRDILTANGELLLDAFHQSSINMVEDLNHEKNKSKKYEELMIRVLATINYSLSRTCHACGAELKLKLLPDRNDPCIGCDCCWEPYA